MATHEGVAFPMPADQALLNMIGAAANARSVCWDAPCVALAPWVFTPAVTQVLVELATPRPILAHMRIERRNADRGLIEALHIALHLLR